MRKVLNALATAAAALCLAAVLGVVAFDFLVVQPQVEAVRAAVSAAAPGEREPPAAVIEMIHRAHHGAVAPHAVRLLGIDSRSHLRKVSTEAGLSILLPLHLSDQELTSFLLSRSYMGPDTRGFAQASLRHLGVPLESVDRAQAARLVAIAHAPSIYLVSPERLARRVAWLLEPEPR